MGSIYIHPCSFHCGSHQAPLLVFAQLREALSALLATRKLQLPITDVDASVKKPAQCFLIFNERPGPAHDALDPTVPHLSEDCARSEGLVDCHELVNGEVAGDVSEERRLDAREELGDRCSLR